MSKKKLKLSPQILYDENGRKSGVILKFNEFDDLIEKLSDLQSLRTVYKRMQKPTKTVSFEDAMKQVLSDDIQKRS